MERARRRKKSGRGIRALFCCVRRRRRARWGPAPAQTGAAPPPTVSPVPRPAYWPVSAGGLVSRLGRRRDQSAGGGMPPARKAAPLRPAGRAPPSPLHPASPPSKHLTMQDTIDRPGTRGRTGRRRASRTTGRVPPRETRSAADMAKSFMMVVLFFFSGWEGACRDRQAAYAPGTRPTRKEGGEGGGGWGG